jgi:hypothetical protein
MFLFSIAVLIPIFFRGGWGCVTISDKKFAIQSGSRANQSRRTTH